MKLDLNELEKGAEAALEKQAIVPLLTGAAARLAPLLGRVPWATIGSGALRLGNSALTGLGNMAMKRPILTTLTGATLAPEGFISKPLDWTARHVLPTDTYNTIKGITNVAGTAKDAVSTAADTAWEGVKAVTNAGGSSPAPGQPAEAGKTPLIQGTDAVRKAMQDWRTMLHEKGLSGALGSLYDKAQGAVGDFVSKNLGTGDFANAIGQYALPTLGIASALGLGYHLLSPKKKRRFDGFDEEDDYPRRMSYGGAGGQPVINVNVGGGSRIPALLDQAPGAVSGFSTKYGELASKQADIISETLLNAAKNRVANKLIDKAISKPSEASGEKTESKKLEIVSKHPKIKELLKDEKNKEYLERLISE